MLGLPHEEAWPLTKSLTMDLQSNRNNLNSVKKSFMCIACSGKARCWIKHVSYCDLCWVSSKGKPFLMYSCLLHGSCLQIFLSKLSNVWLLASDLSLPAFETTSCYIEELFALSPDGERFCIESCILQSWTMICVSNSWKQRPTCCRTVFSTTSAALLMRWT